MQHLTRVFSAYEVIHHERVARLIGMSEERIATLSPFAESTVYTSFDCLQRTGQFCP